MAFNDIQTVIFQRGPFHLMVLCLLGKFAVELSCRTPPRDGCLEVMTGTTNPQGCLSL